VAVGQHAVHASKSIPVPTWTRPQVGESLPVQNGIVRRAGKSIIRMLLRGHQMTADGLQLCSFILILVPFNVDLFWQSIDYYDTTQVFHMHSNTDRRDNIPGQLLTNRRAACVKHLVLS